MAGYFTIGERKIRPGAYFNVQTNDVRETGAIDGVVAVLFRATTGPLGEVKTITRADGYEKLYGTGGTTDAMREAFKGGASEIVACRIGTGGAVGSVSLTAGDGSVKIESKYPGAAKYTVTVRAKLSDASRKECIIFMDEKEIEKISFAAGEDEAAALVAAFASSKGFKASSEEGSGIVTNVSQSAFSGGEDPTVSNTEYSTALSEVEKYYFNTICIDSEEEDVQKLVAAFLDRIYLSGQFGISVLAPKSTLELEEKMQKAAAFNAENVIYPINPDANTGSEDLKGYQVAAYIAGIVAATPSSRSVTHTVLDRYASLNEMLTGGEIETAEENGCLVLSTASDGSVWLDNGINTLVSPDENHDDGWKKIRRVRARYELLWRANAAADNKVGRVNNDVNGRAIIASAIQAVCNDMVDEGKLQSATVTESTTITADTDTCGFVIDVVDLDSAEHIYLTYFFRFSTVISAE